MLGLNGQKLLSLQRNLIRIKMKIALIGYGKMGKMIEEIARSRGHEIVSIIDTSLRLHRLPMVII